jgi:hypothetical protein
MHLSDLKLQKTDSSLVEILIGMNKLSANSIQSIREPIDGEMGATAVQTIFGWTIVGQFQHFSLMAQALNQISILRIILRNVANHPSG